MNSDIAALFFDQDGVIVDTEKNGHRIAFNRAFEEFGIDAVWDVETYHHLLSIGGGKERMRSYFHSHNYFEELDSEDFENLIRRLHTRKTELLIEMIEEGSLPLRPGVHRLMEEARDRGLILGVCTTSNEKTCHAILNKLLRDIQFSFILAGDCVTRKKPDPEIYHKALEVDALTPTQAIVIEDSYIGTLAAKRAGLHVVSTVNEYTKNEDMSNADLVLSSLGNDTEETRVIKETRKSDIGSKVSLEELINYFISS